MKRLQHAILFSIGSLCAAQATDSPTEAIQNIAPALSPRYNDGYLSFYFDNDLFGGTDENYTNGARLTWISKSRELEELPGLYRSLDWLLQQGDRRGGEPWLYNIGISLTQLMFTPEDVLATTLIEDDRPYAGWLGLGFSLHAKTAEDLHSLELSLGVVGPASLAENAQDSIHSLRDIDKSQGWDHQLENEFTFNLHYRYTRQWFEASAFQDRLEMDGLYRVGFDLGNAWINANAATYFRAGWNLPTGFTDPSLSPTAYTQQLFVERRERLNPWSLYVTVGAEGRIVGRDIFLDGNTFEDSPSVDKRHFVGDLVGAVTLRYKQFNMSYAHTYRTEEHAGQDGGQIFGSFNIGVSF